MKTLVMKSVILGTILLILNTAVHGTSINMEEFLVFPALVDTWSLYTEGDYILFTDSMDGQLYGYQLSQEDLFEIPSEAYPNILGFKGGYAVFWFNMTPGLYGYDLGNRSAFTITSESVWDPGYLPMSRRYVFWLAPNSSNPSLVDLWGYDLAEKQDFLITSSLSIDLYSMKAAGNHVVWYDMEISSLLAYDIAAEEIMTLAVEEEVDATSVAMTEGYALWMDLGGALQAYEFSTGQSFLLASGNVDFSTIKRSGPYVIWRDTDQMILLAYDLQGRELIALTDYDADIYTLVLSSPYAVWTDPEMKLQGYDLAARQGLPINIPYERGTPPSISGEYLVWLNYDYDTMTAAVRGFHLSLMQPFFVAAVTDSDQFPQVSDEYVFWLDPVDGMNNVLRGARIFVVEGDLCAEAVELTAGIPVPGDSTGATGTDLTGCGTLDIRDVWHRYTPSAGGQVTITTEGSQFDTTLSVFDTCGGLELACNDDYSIHHTQSKVELTVVKGKTYRIRVAGFDKQAGPYQVLVSRGICASPGASDLSGDCRVNLNDFVILASEWLTCGLQPESACEE